jgi:hypothetical protein
MGGTCRIGICHRRLRGVGGGVGEGGASEIGLNARISPVQREGLAHAVDDARYARASLRPAKVFYWSTEVHYYCGLHIDASRVVHYD